MTTPPLSETFQFSQSILQDYDDCRRRFQLRYVLMQPWPALITDTPSDLEQSVRRGTELHRLAHQHALGLDAGLLAATIHDETLARWWQTFISHPPTDLPQAIRRPEVVVSAPLAGYRLVAKFDLLAADPGGRLVVVDWKTVQRRPSRAVLARRLQTRVYRTLAVEAGAVFFGGRSPRPEQVEMIYWFAEQAGATERFAYDADQHAATMESLARLVAEIAQTHDEIWPLTPDQRQCRFCNYRSLCERGVKAGLLGELDDDRRGGVTPPLLDAETLLGDETSPLLEQISDLEQIAEIEF
jgi:hypothetical protein